MPAKKVRNNEELALLGVNYVQTKNAIKELDGKCKELRKPLEDYVDAIGKKLPNGNLLSVIPYADKDVHIKKTLRVSNVLLPEAIDVLTAEGLSECIENVPTVREDVIERLHSEGRISDEVLSKIYAPKSNYAFSVELKNRVDEPEE